MIPNALHSGMFARREPRTKEDLLNISKLLENSQLLKTKKENIIIHSKLGTSSSIVINAENTKKINIFSFHGNAEDIYTSNDKNLLIGHVIIDNFLASNKCESEGKFLEVDLYNIGYPVIDDYTKNPNDILSTFSGEVLNAWCDDVYEFLIPKLSDPDYINIFIGYSIGTGFLTKLLSVIPSDGFPPDHVLLLAPISSIDEIVFNDVYFANFFRTFFWKTEFNYFDLDRDLFIFKNKFGVTNIVVWCGLEDSIFRICGTSLEKILERGLVSYIEYKNIDHNEFSVHDVLKEIITKLYQRHIHDALVTLFDVSALTPDATPDIKQT